jgi:aryl-alcohol dehydrogenase-like predicted oxidoreductase
MGAMAQISRAPTDCANLPAVQLRELGPLGPISALSLGGGGLGQVWGPTDRDEAVATVHAAVAAGVALLDLAPAYGRGESERVIAEAFAGRLPAGVRVSTKVMLGDPVDERPEDRIRRSVERSLETLALDRVDLCFLHTAIVEDGRVLPTLGEHQHRRATSWTTYADAWRPTMAALVDEGIVGAWGITGTGPPATVLAALADEPRPAAVQAIANLLGSAGDIRRYDEPERPREIIETATALGIGVLGIRAVAAGALTDAVDREIDDEVSVAVDFARAEPIRALAGSLGLSTAALAHRYALTMTGVDSVVLGVKNRVELAECLDAEAAGPLAVDVMAAIDALAT